jgi:hypothetical protein
MEFKIVCDGVEEHIHEFVPVFLALICAAVDHEAPLSETGPLELPFEIVCGVQ